MNELIDFMTAYERANNSHIWAHIEPFIAPDASYWFTDGSYSGLAQIRNAVEDTFSQIQDEVYTIEDLAWPVATNTVAVCTYRFSWRGIVEGKPASGTGRGTNVMEKYQGRWRIVHEHLSV